MKFIKVKNIVYLMMIVSIIVLFSCSENNLTEPIIDVPDTGYDFQSPEEFSEFLYEHEYAIWFEHEIVAGRKGWHLEVNHLQFRGAQPVDLIINEHEINAYVHPCRCDWNYSFMELIGYDLEHGQDISMTMTTEKGTSTTEFILPDKPVLKELPTNFKPDEDLLIEWELTHDSDVQRLTVIVSYTIYHKVSYTKMLKENIRSYKIPANTFPDKNPISYRVFLQNMTLNSVNNDLIIGYAVRDEVVDILGD